MFKSVVEAVRRGDLIVVLRGTKRVKVDGQVSLRDVIKLRRGSRVLSELPSTEDDGHPIEGRLHFVDLAASPINDLFYVWAEVPNPYVLLRGGLTATLQILPDETARANPSPHRKHPDASCPARPPRERYW